MSFKHGNYVSKRYANSIKSVIDYITKASRDFKTVGELTTFLNSLVDKPWFRTFANRTALNMVKSIVVENATSWREAARKGTKSGSIHRMLRNEVAGNKKFQSIIRANANVIESIPANLAKNISNKAATAAVRGIRGSELVKHLQSKLPDIGEAQAKTIVRTEIAKANAAITQTRAEAVGVHWYIWRTSHDRRTRHSHQIMEGVLCSYMDPPKPELLDKEAPPSAQRKAEAYNPGEIYNCRCYAEPVVDPDLIDFPRKIARNGTIERINKQDFKALS